MEIRSRRPGSDVFVDTLHAAFARSGTPTEAAGSGGRRSKWTATHARRDARREARRHRRAYSFELTCPVRSSSRPPGEAPSASALTPDARRAQRDDEASARRAAGPRELLSVLLATEALIYRFGYGTGDYTSRLTVPAHQAALALPRARRNGRRPSERLVEVLRVPECGEILEEVYDRYRRAHPGALSPVRTAGGLGRGAAPGLSGAALRRRPPGHDGVPDGYASYSVRCARHLDGRRDHRHRLRRLHGPGRVRARTRPGHQGRVQARPARAPAAVQLRTSEPAHGGDDTDWLWVRLPRRPPRALTARGWFMDASSSSTSDDPVSAEHPLPADRTGTAGPTASRQTGARPVLTVSRTWARLPGRHRRARSCVPDTIGPTARRAAASRTPSSAPSAPRTACTGSDRALASLVSRATRGLQRCIAVFF